LEREGEYRKRSYQSARVCVPSAGGAAWVVGRDAGRGVWAEGAAEADEQHVVQQGQQVGADVRAADRGAVLCVAGGAVGGAARDGFGERGVWRDIGADEPGGGDQRVSGDAWEGERRDGNASCAGVTSGTGFGCAGSASASGVDAAAGVATGCGVRRTGGRARCFSVTGDAANARWRSGASGAFAVRD